MVSMKKNSIGCVICVGIWTFAIDELQSVEMQKHGWHSKNI